MTSEQPSDTRRRILWRQALWCFHHGFPKTGWRYLVNTIKGHDRG